MAALSDLVRDTNRYMSGGRGGATVATVAPPAAATTSSTPETPSSAAASSPSAAPPPPVVAHLPNLHLLRAAADYVTGMFRVFGLVDAVPGIGFSLGGAGEASEASPEALLSPYLDVLAAFREAVREGARAGNLQRVLAACDSLRDESLRPLGVVLEDEGTGPAGSGQGGKWKLRDPAELRREDEERRAAAEEKAAKKAEAAAELAKRAAEKEEKARVDPHAMFLERRDAFSAWDAEGVPTHDAAGEALPPATVKRLQKDRAQQDKLHQWWLAKFGGGGAAPPS